MAERIRQEKHNSKQSRQQENDQSGAQTKQEQTKQEQTKQEQTRHESTNKQSTNDQKKRSRSFKHVKLERERPHLSRQTSEKGSGGSTPASQKSGSAKNGTQEKQAVSSGHKTLPVPKRDPKAKLKIIPLGGLDAIGKNMTVFECKGDMILDDAGLMFPDDDHPGIDLILPDYTYVLEHADRLRGIVITHGHEDHTGTLPYLLKDLDRPIPIYASKLTLGLIEGKLAEHRVKNAKLCEIKAGDQIKLGCMTAEFFAVNHSIPGALGVMFRSPAGNVLHTGDFKLDQTPIDGVHTDFGALARFGEEGVDLMMSDSTNAMKESFTPSEAEVGKVLSKIIEQAKGRVVIASFASHIHRMQQICDAARANGRKVVVTGRSMIQNTDIARRLGYLNIPDSELIDAYELKGIPPEQVVVMCTGSQGEPLSALSRIANGEHKTVLIEKGDTVIISASPVPGNEKAVTRIVNKLAKIGADVYDKSRAQVHVSGHAGAEELKLVLSIVQPRAFMPVHGEASHLRAHAKLAQAIGIPDKNIFLCENGESLELSDKGTARGETVPSGIVFVDGLSVGDTSQNVLNERTALASQGFASIAVAVSLKKKLILSEVQLEMRGITGGDDVRLYEDATRSVASALKKALSSGLSSRELERSCKNALLSVLWERTKQRPMTVVSLLEI